MTDAENITVRQMLDLASERIGERFEGQPAREAAVRATIGDAYHLISEFEPAIAQLTLSYELHKNVPGTPPLELMRILANLCGAARGAGHNEEAARRWVQDVELAVQFLLEDYPALGRVADDMRRSLIGPDPPSDDDVRAHVGALLDAYAAAMSPDQYDGMAVFHVLCGIGFYLENSFGAGDGQQRLMEAALEISRQASGEPLLVVIMLGEVGRNPARPGEEEQRIALAREMVDLARRTVPPNHWLQADAEGILGEALVQRGRLEDREEAVRLLVDSYRAIRDRRGPKFFRTTLALERLAGRSGIGTLMSHEQQRYLRHPAVREALREGVEQEADPAALNAIASAMIRYPGLDTAHYDLALHAAQRANELAPNDAAIVKSLGVAQYRAGHYEEAIPTVVRADALAIEAGLGELPTGWAIVAMAHHQLGHVEEARAALQHLCKLMEDPDKASNAENRDFLREAEELIEAGAGDPG